MDNTILKYLSVENFASFADKIEFTTEIDSGKKEFIERIRFYASVQNPFLFTSFPGVDPEGARGKEYPRDTVSCYCS